MNTPLVKAQGAGNDFLLGWGEWPERFAADPGLIARLCHRRLGVGADGVLALVREAADRLRLGYWNSDGSRAAFCANGTRCAARVAVERLGLTPRLVVVTEWAEITAQVTAAEVALELPAPDTPLREVVLATPRGTMRGIRFEVGVPHLILSAGRTLDELDVGAIGPTLAHHPELGPGGANVSFVERRGDGTVAIRSWERGVEGETLACGSAVVAAGLLEAVATGASRVAVQTRSGEILVVEPTGEPPMCPARLTGPARLVADVTVAAEFLARTIHQ